jgi:outer membrane protein TolC
MKQCVFLLRFPECRVHRSGQRARWKILVAILIPSFVHIGGAVTLDNALEATLEKNPEIQQAKANLEQAAGQRLVLRSIMWPDANLRLPAGVQGGHRAGESGVKGFGFLHGSFTQALFNVAIPPSRRRGDVEVLIAQQQLNVAVVERLHTARLAFYAALYDRALEAIRRDQRQRSEENVASQKQRYEAGLIDHSAFTSATVQARELDSLIEEAHRACAEARLRLAEAMGRKLGPGAALPDAEGELQFDANTVDVDSETAAALARRADLKLAHLFARAANEDLRIVEAGYYPVVEARVSGEYIPVTGIHREGTSRQTEDISSQIRAGGAYTWRVIDNGKVGGAAMKQRAIREMNELTCQKLEANVRRELLHIHRDLEAAEARHESFAAASTAAEQTMRGIEQNLAGGLASELEYRQAQNSFLDTKSGLLEATYRHNLAAAEWDRATGRYFQFSEDTAQNVH